MRKMIKSMDHLYKAAPKSGPDSGSVGSSPQRRVGLNSFANRHALSPRRLTQQWRSSGTPQPATKAVASPGKSVASPGSASPAAALQLQQETAMLDGRTQRLRKSLVDSITGMEVELADIHFTEDLTTHGSKKIKGQLQDIALPIGFLLAYVHTYVHIYIYIYTYTCKLYIYMISHATSVKSIQVLGCATFRYDCVCSCQALCVFVCVWL